MAFHHKPAKKVVKFSRAASADSRAFSASRGLGTSSQMIGGNSQNWSSYPLLHRGYGQATAQPPNPMGHRHLSIVFSTGGLGLVFI
jgi:hypothetical protein